MGLFFPYSGRNGRLRILLQEWLGNSKFFKGSLQNNLCIRKSHKTKQITRPAKQQNADNTVKIPSFGGSGGTEEKRA